MSIRDKARLAACRGLMAGLILLSGAFLAAQDVRYNYDFGTDFAKFKTYKWVTIEGGTAPDQLLDQQIRGAFDAVLAKKGFTRSTGDQADLWIGYQVGVQQEKQLNFYGGTGWRVGAGMATASTTTIQVGQMVFDAYDPATKQLVWRGSATKTINPSKDPQKNQEELQKGVTKLLANFPPKPKK